MTELVPGVFLPETRARLLAIVRVLTEREGIDAVIRGGTELPLILRAEDVASIGLPVLDHCPDSRRSDCCRTAIVGSSFFKEGHMTMRIAIYGTGGAGGYFGSRLAQSGKEVTFIARGDHLRAIREHGLRVESDNGTTVTSAQATDDPREVGSVDVVIIGVKSWQVTDAAHAILPMIGPKTFVVPLQNGVEASSQLAKVLGSDHVLGGLCGTFSWVIAPGCIRSIGKLNFIKFGELNNQLSERSSRLRTAFESAGVKVEIPADIQVALWEKLLLVAGHGGLGAVTRAPVGILRSLPQTREIIEVNCTLD